MRTKFIFRKTLVLSSIGLSSRMYIKYSNVHPQKMLKPRCRVEHEKIVLEDFSISFRMKVSYLKKFQNEIEKTFWLLHLFFNSNLNLDAFCNVYWLFFCIQAVGDNLQGFMNCLLYCVFTPKVYNHIKQKLLTSCKCSPPTMCCTLQSRGRYLESFDTEDEEGASLFKK